MLLAKRFDISDSATADRHLLDIDASLGRLRQWLCFVLWSWVSVVAFALRREKKSIFEFNL
jgi:hypothetical protein